MPEAHIFKISNVCLNNKNTQQHIFKIAKFINAKGSYFHVFIKNKNKKKQIKIACVHSSASIWEHENT